MKREELIFSKNEYKLLEYIQIDTNHKAQIDSGVFHSSNLYAIMDIQSERSTTSSVTVYGGLSAGGGMWYGQKNGVYVLNNSRSISSPLPGSRHITKIKYPSSRITELWVENSYINIGGSVSSYPTNQSYKIGIPNYIYVAFKIYEAKIFDGNDTLLRHFVPVLRIEDNKPGLFDLCGSICSMTNTSFYISTTNAEFVYDKSQL